MTRRFLRAGAGLVGRLRPVFDRGDDGPGGWRILYEPELHLDEEVLVPDLAGWRRERLPELPDTAYFSLAPDWVCEVLSPSTRKLDLVHKRPIYAPAAVAHLWLIDPDERILEAFERMAMTMACGVTRATRPGGAGHPVVAHPRPGSPSTTLAVQPPPQLLGLRLPACEGLVPLRDSLLLLRPWSVSTASRVPEPCPETGPANAYTRMNRFRIW